MVHRIDGNPFIYETSNSTPITGFKALKTLNSCFGNGYTSNPIENKKISDKQKIYENLDKIKNPELRAEVENILQGGTPSQAFIDMLLKRYEKKQAEFEEAWARYQEAKGERASLKKTLETIQKRYANSESNYENGLVTKAEKNYKNADLDADILLSIASYLAHRAV